MADGLGWHPKRALRPFAIVEDLRPDVIGGASAPGVSIKLVPNEGKLEAPSQSCHGWCPGYLRQPEFVWQSVWWRRLLLFGGCVCVFGWKSKTAARLSFRWPCVGDFKLDSGTWVSAGTLRAKFISAVAPFGNKNAVLVWKQNRSTLLRCVFPDWTHCRYTLALYLKLQWST